MSTIIQHIPSYPSKRSQLALVLTFTVGLCIILFYFRIPTFYKSIQCTNKNVTNAKSLNLGFWTKFNYDPSLPTLCVVTRIYYAQISYFPVFALALYHSHLHNIRIYLVSTDNRTNIEQLEQAIQFTNQLVSRNDFVSLLDLGQPSTDRDYGYRMTDRALTYLYQQYKNSSSICQYITLTNADNFYSRNFLKKILPHMQAGKDIIAWGFLSHHFKPQYYQKIDPKNKTVPEVIDDGTEKCTPVELRAGSVDLGAVAYRLAFLQAHNLLFQYAGRGYSFNSDGYFAETAARLTNTSVILKQTLFVHQ